ncbi:MAG TPA: hypothetical protein VH134_15400 [Candidatus Dormibacteraeota bacterium]|nr:hypothetical protein [Candidatus Dormibacteraeota bacterium]
MPPAPLRARTAVLLAVAAVLGGCGSASFRPAAAHDTDLAAAVHTLLAAGGFHLVYVDGDRSRTLVADVSATGDAAGTLLVGSERFPFRSVAGRVFLQPTSGASWAELSGGDAAPYRAVPQLLAALPACLAGTATPPADAGTATLDGERARLLTYPTAGVETDLSDRPHPYLVRFTRHRPGPVPAGCPGADITADISGVGSAPQVRLPEGVR